mgnify:CR=1 FL=1
MELENVKGIGPKTKELLNKINIYSVDELVRYYPYRYNIYSPENILNHEDEQICITGMIEGVPKLSYIKRNLNKISFTFLTNNIRCNVVIFNRAFINRYLTVGKYITLVGKYKKDKNQFIASDIKLKPIYKTEVEPVYHLVNGLKTSTLESSIKSILESNIEINEIVPDFINDMYGFIKSKDAIKEIHFPTSLEETKKANLKLKYEELFEFLFKINIIKYRNQLFNDYVIKHVDESMIDSIKKQIPYSLTGDQEATLNEIIDDFNSFKRMNRLIMGDVGCGKTIVAFIAVMLNYKCGYQSAILAPTEVLASQHYENFISLFPDIRVEFLVGSKTKKQKEIIKEKLKNGEVDVLIGTHAMLEDDVEFKNIGLVVTDEQHRFGVNQRKSLQNKGEFVDVLYLSATPIPRTYALTIYGDMDISIIKEKPAGRKDIATKVLKFSEMEMVLKTIKEEIDNHHQVYVVAPLIEESESDLNDVNTIYELISKNISDIKIDILHGKMKNVDKDRVINNFKEGILDLIISTTVIEVGVDVKNATLMVIFNAERFGLATLHQLRGRVGRNSLESKCILISDQEKERLHVLEESNDGFYVSEMDFKMRGSGDLFGIRQSGDMVFKIADLKKDYKILLQCKKDVDKFILDNIENSFRNYSYYNAILESLMNNND